MKTGDQAFLDIRSTEAERTLHHRSGKKLYPKNVRPYTVLQNDGATIVLDVDGVPERINSDRIRSAPCGEYVLPSETPVEECPSEIRFFNAMPPKNQLGADGQKYVATHAAVSEEEFVIENLLRGARHKDGQIWDLVQWYGYTGSEAIWQRKDSLSPVLVARLKNSRIGILGEFS